MPPRAPTTTPAKPIRKVVVNDKTTERVYVGGAWETYRDYCTGTSVEAERETLHVVDGEQRVAMVETLTVTSGSPVSSPSPVLRYQLGNHLGTVSLELDGAGEIISYEEYHPHGTTAWQAPELATISLKRYRYTGMERDEESGLQCHGSRYYLPWLGRWLSADPIGVGDGVNRYAYARGAPTQRKDPTGLASGGRESLAEPIPGGPPRDTREDAFDALAAKGLEIGGRLPAARGDVVDLGFDPGARDLVEAYGGDLRSGEYLQDFAVPESLSALVAALAARTTALTPLSEGRQGFETGGYYFARADGSAGFVWAGDSPGRAIDLGQVAARGPADAAFVLELHTHPRSSVTTFSRKDVEAFSRNARSSGTGVIGTARGREPANLALLLRPAPPGPGAISQSTIAPALDYGHIGTGAAADTQASTEELSRLALTPRLGPLPLSAVAPALLVYEGNAADRRLSRVSGAR